MRAVLWVWSWRARGYHTPAFAGKNRPFLAHGRQRSLEGSWRGKALSGGHDGDLRERCARGLQMGLPDSCVRGKGAPVPFRPLRAQARRRQNPKDGCNPNPATSAKASPQPTTYYDEAGKLAPLPIDRHFRPLQVPAFTVIFSAPASRGRPSRSAAVKAACRLTDS